MRLLLVSPRFPPTSAADSQRLRMLLPHLVSQGCSVEVLAVEPDCCTEGIDSWQAEHLPPSVPVHRVRGLPRSWGQLPGLGSLDARCHGALAKAGSRLFSQRNFDAVYFSTTEFGCFRLGPYWKYWHGVPFLLDYQDPWVNDHYSRHPEIRPPGGRLKYMVVDRLSRLTEPRVLRNAAGYTAVSAAYPAQIQSRYSFAVSIPSLVLPFPGSEDDFQRLNAISFRQLPFNPHDGLIHWVCIGRADADLFNQSLTGLFKALSHYISTELLQRLRLHFLGTSYAPAGQGIPSISLLAAHFGLGGNVEERVDRLPLSLTLATLKAADALLVLGSNDPGYTASKIYPYLLARRPLLAVVHEQSSVVNVLQECGGGQCVSFTEYYSSEQLANRIAEAWLANGAHRQIVDLDRRAFTPHTAAAQAAQLLAFLDTCIRNG